MLGALWTIENRPNMDDLPTYAWPESVPEVDVTASDDSYVDTVSDTDNSQSVQF